jgi:hypothetical protein
MWVAHHQGLHKGKPQSMIFLVETFCHFEKQCSIKNSTVKIKNNLKTTKKQQKLPQLPIV